MNIDEEAKKVLWSLQNNKRTEEERNAFKPTGKKPKSNGPKYVAIVLLGLLAISFLMIQFQKETVQVCVIANYCIDSSVDKTAYLSYVFVTNVILVFGIYYAYKIGKILGEKLKQ